MRWLIFLLFALPAAAQDNGALIQAARGQVGVTTIYDPAYVSIAFPGGDIAAERGVCTDVIIRAFRTGWGIDLQLAINRDMKANFAAYPQLWGLTRTDRNIDHRRVPNLATLFTRAGAALTPTSDPASYLPGDIVTSMLPGNLPHIGIVSDQKAANGNPLILHNIGAGAQEEDRLFAHQITGHFRLTDSALAYLRRLTD
jgi:uncharacterized protein